MSAEAVIASHLRLASEALQAAETLLAIGNRNAAYEAEQQMLLALVQAEGLHIARSHHHQLDTINRLLPIENEARSRLAGMTWLEAYATTYRYPRPFGGLRAQPKPDMLDGTIAAARQLLVALGSHFGVDLDSRANAPGAHARPPRAGDLIDT